jgi:short-subunit dehydrogenase
VTTNTFREKTVVVTGASSGIGKALTLQLADEGAWLALAAREVQRLDALVLECQQRGGKAIAIPTDVADESQCCTLIQRTRETYGRIDMLVNNAGMAVVSKLEDLPDLHHFKQVMDVNFYGMVYCTYYALPYIKEASGRIVNVSSLGGVMAIPFNTSYIASKFAVNGFSDSLRMELTKAGVSVTVICPYWVVTEFHERYLDRNGKPKGPSGRAIYTDKTMTANRCAQIILKAARRRKREVLMGPGRMGVWLKLIAPNLVDKMVVEAVLRPAAKRVSDDDAKQHL